MGKDELSQGWVENGPAHCQPHPAMLVGKEGARPAVCQPLPQPPRVLPEAYGRQRWPHSYSDSSPAPQAPRGFHKGR